MATRPFPNRAAWVALAALSAALAFPFLDARGLYETTEGRYALAGAEMLETGNWWVPQLDHIPHWTKPPLTYWAIGGSMAVFGSNERGARFPNAVALVLLIFGVAALGAALWDRPTGYLAALVYAGSLLPAIAANQVSTDVLLALWELLAVLFYWNAVRFPRAQRKWVVLMWVMFGLGFLTKGPPALLSLLPILVVQVWQKRRGVPMPRLLSPVGLVLFAVISFTWFLSVTTSHTGLMSYFLLQEVWGRVFSSEFHRNTPWYSPATIYLPPLILGLGAWLVFWPRLIARYRGWFRWAELPKRPEVFFLLLWVVLPLIVLSISKSRLPLYVVPFFPALALVTARGLLREFGLARALRLAMPIAAATAALLIAAKGTSGLIEGRSDMRALAAQVQPLLGPDTRIYAVDAGVLFGLQFYLQRHIERVSSTLPLPEKFTTTLDAAAAEIRGLPPYTRALIITRPIAPEGMKAICVSAGPECTQTPLRSGYMLWLIGPTPLQADGREYRQKEEDSLRPHPRPSPSHGEGSGGERPLPASPGQRASQGKPPAPYFAKATQVKPSPVWEQDSATTPLRGGCYNRGGPEWRPSLLRPDNGLRRASPLSSACTRRGDEQRVLEAVPEWRNGRRA